MKMNWLQKAALSLSCLVGTLIPSGMANAQKCIGINDHIIWRSNAEQDAAFAKYADSNTKYLRVGADWNVMQPTQPSPAGSATGYNSYYTDRLDYFFQKCTAANIRVLLTPAYAPDWAVAANTGNQGGYAPDADKTVAFADFCEYLLRRYATATYTNSAGQHTLEAIEIWNEPDFFGGFFKPFINDASPTATNGVVAAATRYGDMVVKAGGRIKSVRGTIGASDVMVLAPAISQVHNVTWAASGDSNWMDSFYAVPNVTANYDIFSWHTYWESSGTGWLPAILPACWNPSNQMQAVLGKLIATNTGEIWGKMVAKGDNLKPNWCTEIGGAARSTTADHPNRFLSLAEQQTHLADAINTLQAGNVTNLNRIYWYEIFDEPHLYNSGQQGYFGLLGLNTTNPITYTGGINLTAATFTPKPAYATYKNSDKGSSGFSLTDDFNDGNSNGWTATSGTWAVVSNEYRSPHNANIGVSSVGDIAWTNYSAQAKLKFVEAWKSAGIIARYNGSTGYYLRIGVNATTLSYTIQLLKGTTVVATTSINNTYDFKTYHTVKISVKDEIGGTRILGLIDNNQHINYLDTSSPYAVGKFALRSEPWTGNIYVDDVVINSN